MPLVKINNRYLNDVNWLNGSLHDYAVSNNVDVWRINVSSNLSSLDSFISIMTEDEIARAGRYFHNKDKSRFIISRGALRSILGKYSGLPPGSVEFEIGPNKKPHIKNTGNLYFNISHSGDWILIAVSSFALGADTEMVNPAYNYQDVLTDNFSHDEINYINKSLSAERFFLLWTRKEALTKATGKGLDEQLKLIPCLDGIHFAESNIISSNNNWIVNSFKLNQHYLASVASNTKAGEPRFFDIYL